MLEPGDFRAAPLRLRHVEARAAMAVLCRSVLGLGRSWWVGLGVVLPGLVLAGCGGRAAGDDPSDEEERGTTDVGGRGGAGGRGGGEGVGAAPAIGPPGPIDLGSVRLPDCEPGFRMSAGGSRPCTYSYQGDCYDEALVACACACQGLADSQCIIVGFLNPDEPERVSCVPR